jgi:AraC-like DNA-binding protein
MYIVKFAAMDFSPIWMDFSLNLLRSGDPEHASANARFSGFTTDVRSTTIKYPLSKQVDRMAKSNTGIITAEDRLRAAGLIFNRLEDVSPTAVREVNRSGFLDMRSILLPPQSIRESLQKPLLGDLLVTRVGYATRLAGHYIPRPDGSLDHILHFCSQGSGWLRIGGREWKVGPASMFCIPANVPHWYGADDTDPWSVYWLHFTGRHAAHYFRFLNISVERPLLVLEDYEQLVSAFEELWAAMKHVHVWENLVAASALLVRYLYVLRELRQRPGQRARDRANAVAKSVSYMTANLSTEVSLAELAALAEMSLSRYTAEFRLHNGCSPIEFLNRLRMQKACELLRNTDKTVRRIAVEVGFTDPYYFSRAFRKIAGCSPLAFRNGKGIREARSQPPGK